ncbi:MAG: hypothetical protein ACXAC2_05105 [Candidatus Kariarchaeaceae archaeon]
MISDFTRFQLYFGILHPILAIGIVISLGFILFKLLLIDHRWEIYNDKTHHGFVIAALTAPLFGFITILIDLQFKYPKDINAEIQSGVLFYPVMGFVVEIIFHVLPLSITWYFINQISDTNLQNKFLKISIIIIALIEPLFQLAFGTPDYFPIWIAIYFGVHLFVFNYIQLQLFNKYDFVSMYSFRLVYYLLWHIIWGYMRLFIIY